MEEIEQYVDVYLTNRDVYTVEEVLNKLIEVTNLENYMHIVNYIINHKNATHELDLSLYITEIATKEYTELKSVIVEKLKTYTDRDAIEDLENALKKMNS